MNLGSRGPVLIDTGVFGARLAPSGGPMTPVLIGAVVLGVAASGAYLRWAIISRSALLTGSAGRRTW